MRKLRCLSALFPVLLFIGLWICLLREASFSFLYREQHQLFLYDWDFFLSKLDKIGGLGEYLSEYLVQFFISYQAGPLLTALLMSLSAVFLSLGLRRLTKSPVIPLVGMIPALMLALCCHDVYVLYSALVAFFFSSLLFLLLTLLPLALPWALRPALECVLSVALYLSMGSSALPFTVLVLLYDLLL